MKKVIGAMLFLVSSLSFAETCTEVMRDRNGYEVQRFTRYAYSYYAACDEARYDCTNDMSERSVRGQWGLNCSELNTNTYPTPSYPAPYPSPYPSYPAPSPYPSYPPSYPPTYPRPLPPRDPHWPSEPPRGPGREPGRGHDRDGGFGRR
jgi:hypothetical protein